MSTLVGESPSSLDDLVANPSLEEVWVNGPNQVFADCVADSGGSSISNLPSIVLSADMELGL